MLLLVAGPVAHAQRPAADTLTWMVDTYQATGSTTDVAQASHFVSSPQKVQWFQRNGTFVYDFTVTSISGSWNLVSSDGELTFHVTFRGFPGMIRFARAQGVTSVQTTVLKDTQNLLPYTFHVTTVQP